jgi:hypothetical protein
VGVGVEVGVGVGVGSGVGVGVTVGVGVGDGSGVGDGEGVGVATGEGFLTATPLFQTSFFPDLMQVNFLPATVVVLPALVHLAPGLTAAKDGAAIRDISSKRTRNKRERVMR